jgi:hypothetical protein
MNKIITLISLAVSVFFINAGISMNAQVVGLLKQKEDLLIQNNNIGLEISQKLSLSQMPPVDISKAFSLVVNKIRFLEGNSGSTMNLMIEKSQDSDEIYNYLIDSQYRGIKKLPVTLQVDKFSNETDLSSVLNDIYQLEVETDFKVTEISKTGNGLIVKGDVYGL